MVDDLEIREGTLLAMLRDDLDDASESAVDTAEVLHELDGVSRALEIGLRALAKVGGSDAGAGIGRAPVRTLRGVAATGAARGAMALAIAAFELSLARRDWRRGILGSAVPARDESTGVELSRASRCARDDDASELVVFVLELRLRGIWD